MSVAGTSFKIRQPKLVQLLEQGRIQHTGAFWSEVDKVPQYHERKERLRVSGGGLDVWAA